MKVYLLPKTQYGWWSLGLIIAMPFLFYIGSSFRGSLYQGVSSGRTILEDIVKRPALSLTMLTGMGAGIAAFITGLRAFTKQKDWGLLVFVSTLSGFLLILFLSGEIISAH